MTETQAKWAARVEDWKGSGQSARTFAQGKGFAAANLHYWSSRLRREPPAPPSKGAVPMIQVVANAHETLTNKLVVQVGAVRIVVAQGFDRELLRQVIGALTQSGGAQ
jgi:hypothetical protein